MIRSGSEGSRRIVPLDKKAPPRSEWAKWCREGDKEWRSVSPGMGPEGAAGPGAKQETGRLFD